LFDLATPLGRPAEVVDRRISQLKESVINGLQLGGDDKTGKQACSGEREKEKDWANGLKSLPKTKIPDYTSPSAYSGTPWLTF